MNENDENKYSSTTQNVDDKKKERMLKIADSMTEGKLYDKLHVLVHPSSLKVYHYITRRKSNSYRHCHLHLSTES